MIKFINTKHRNFSVAPLVLICLLAGLAREAAGQDLADGLVSYWPLDVVQGTKTPDRVSGYDMTLNNLTAADLVAGKIGNCFSFVNSNQTLLSRVHSPGEDLPINQFDSFTISFWANAVGTGQNDLRFFSEGNTTNSNPLFNLGTHNTGANGTMDLFFRQDQAGLPPLGVVNHILTVGQPFDGTWHHVVMVQDALMRRIYIDGMLDGLAVPDKPDGMWLVNDTTIGGILRSSASHWVTGLIDEVALWKRALSESEILNINANGVPKVFTKPESLTIRTFSADFPTVVAGDTVTLRWDVTKNATVSIDSGVGDVTGLTTAGIGSVAVPVTAPTTFMLTVTRGGESTNAQVSVGAIEGVAAGWRLLENFETRNPGPIAGQASWQSPDGRANVVDLDVNKALGFDAGNDLSALGLKSLTLTEGDIGTLFFRFYASPNDPVSMIGLSVGLTEKPIRFWNDFQLGADIGPYVRFERLAPSSTISIVAFNGVGSSATISDYVISYGKAYNIWIDVTNDTVASGDKFSVYIQEEGAATRTLVFNTFTSDRNPAGSVELGLPTPDLVSVLACAPDAGQSTDYVLLDDFYISLGAYNSTVPVPASVFERPIRITNFTFDPISGIISITWGSVPGAAYAILSKARLEDEWTVFFQLAGDAGTTTTYTDFGTGEDTMFISVQLQQ